MTLFAGCGVFGRDEGGSEFAFTQQHIDGLVLNWTAVMEGQGFSATFKPDATRMLALELCVSASSSGRSGILLVLRYPRIPRCCAVNIFRLQLYSVLHVPTWYLMLQPDPAIKAELRWLGRLR